MKILINLFVYITLLCGLAVSPYAGAEPNKETYELQDKCGKAAGEKMGDMSNGITKDKDGPTYFSNYTNHYNAKLNKCFILITTTSIARLSSNVSDYRELYDVNENKEYGTYFKRKQNIKPFKCKVLDKICTSKSEWDALVKPYMEE